jgi:adenylosuccinate synthase
MTLGRATYVVIHHSDDWDREPEVVVVTHDLGYAMEETAAFPYPKNSAETRPVYRELQAWSDEYRDVTMFRYDDGSWESEVFDRV